jgi:hypothetical protein
VRKGEGARRFRSNKKSSCNEQFISRDFDTSDIFTAIITDSHSFYTKYICYVLRLISSSRIDSVGTVLFWNNKNRHSM